MNPGKCIISTQVPQAVYDQIKAAAAGTDHTLSHYVATLLTQAAAGSVRTVEAVRNGTKTKASVLAPQTERNTEVGCKLAAMTSEVQEWVDQFGVVYLRRQYSDEFKRLVSVVVGTSREKCLFQHNLP
jgi:hypothetical protein